MLNHLSRAAVALALVIATASPAAASPVRDPQQYGEWIADVERPSEQYRRP